MIKYENGTVHIEGTRLDLLSEFMCIVNALHKKGVSDTDTLMTYTYLACADKEELKRTIIDIIDNMDDIGSAWKLLNKLENLNV